MTNETKCSQLGAHDALTLLRTRPDDFCFIDVRSEGEFEKARIPGFRSMPILTDDERHQVGLCFKTLGQKAAVALGHDLVAPDRARRIDAWRCAAAGRPIVTTCWRGGLRSEIAADWMVEAGESVQRVSGGYRAMRHALLDRLEHLPDLLVLTGLTGSGKTELIHDVDVPRVDLEGLANHRGSAFGGFFASPQPTQTNFENELLLVLPQNAPWVLIEDESSFIGSVSLPKPLMAKIKNAPVVFLESATRERAFRIFVEYVREPLEAGMAPDILEAELQSRLDRLARPLGGQRHQELTDKLRAAFAKDPDEVQSHEAWIEMLLVQYYDPRYRYGIERNQRPEIFRGDFASVRAWLRERVAKPLSSF